MIAFATEHPQLSSFIRIARSNGVEQLSWGLKKTADSYATGLRMSRLPCGGSNESALARASRRNALSTTRNATCVASARNGNFGISPVAHRLFTRCTFFLH